MCRRLRQRGFPFATKRPANTSKRSRGAKPSIRPRPIAFEAGINSPRRMTFKARGRPMSRGRRVEPPHAGMRPRSYPPEGQSAWPVRGLPRDNRRPVPTRFLRPRTRRESRRPSHTLSAAILAKVCWPRSTNSARLCVPANSFKSAPAIKTDGLALSKTTPRKACPIQFTKNLRESMEGFAVQHVGRTPGPVESNDRDPVFCGV